MRTRVHAPEMVPGPPHPRAALGGLLGRLRVPGGRPTRPTSPRTVSDGLKRISPPLGSYTRPV
eukprot:2593270-Pyramimonas_sp.AAC.1